MKVEHFCLNDNNDGNWWSYLWCHFRQCPGRSWRFPPGRLGGICGGFLSQVLDFFLELFGGTVQLFVLLLQVPESSFFTLWKATWPIHAWGPHQGLGLAYSRSWPRTSSWWVRTGLFLQLGLKHLEVQSLIDTAQHFKSLHIILVNSQCQFW